jgi:hypothetical protein
MIRRVLRPVVAILLAGCAQIQLPQLPMTMTTPQTGVQSPTQGLPQLASYLINDDRMRVLNTGTLAWYKTRITLYTDKGYFHQQAGIVEPNSFASLALIDFKDQNGFALASPAAIKSVWVHARDRDDRPIDEMAAPASEFGLRPPNP